MLRTRSLVVAAVIAVLSLPSAADAGDLEDERDPVRADQDALAGDLDALTATDAEVQSELARLDDEVAAGEAAVGAAEAEATEASAAASVAAVEARRADADVRMLRRRVRAMAIESFVHPPVHDLFHGLSAESFSDALVQQVFLDARADRDADLIGVYDAALAAADAHRDELAAARVRAADAVDAVTAELAAVQARRDQRLAFAAEVRERIDRALAEAAALEALDAQLSADIAAHQASLLAQLPPVDTPPVVPLSPDGPVATVPPSPPTTLDPATPTTTAPPGGPTPTTTTPPTPPPPPTPGTPPLATVRGITVHASIAGRVEALLAAAAADGIVLGGGGYRSTASQIALRRAHCGPTDYDIWYRPSSQCHPPTAPPGRSMHEQGLAIDFTHLGRVISSRSSSAFQWLAAHAGAYGLYNLPSEPWHWSTTGN